MRAKDFEKKIEKLGDFRTWTKTKRKTDLSLLVLIVVLRT
jgi:hypothetical protein